MKMDKERADMLALMVPASIKIQPFTKIDTFDADAVPDGINLVVRAYDKFGDPVKAVGFWYFELWTYENASGQHRGERLAFWDRNVSTAEEVRLYWTRAQMYQFKLAWTGGFDQLRPGNKYILTATYRAPWDETYRDEYEFMVELPPGVLPAGKAEALNRAGGQQGGSGARPGKSKYQYVNPK
ncbi:MAG: hypothetical protein FWC56_00505 [Phycisphaerae bacterium]|nr:hypothetical protein [Phycisphaerae bacterium]